MGRRASAALAAMAPLQPDSEERAAALQGLQWSAQRLKMLSRRLGAAERARELYRSAYIASASPKAVSDRLLKAADLLESEARALDEHRAEWHALWRRERREPYDPATEAAMRAQVEALRARGARMRALRDRYLQTGSLPITSRMAARRPSPDRSGSDDARCCSSGVWFHISFPPQMPLGVRPTVRM